jgi:hypothetical protein
MKRSLFIISTFFLGLILFASCQKENLKDEQTDILPQNFKVDIPSSISRTVTVTNKDGVMNGNEIYQHLNNFIKIGEGAADLVEILMNGIRRYHLNQAMAFSYTSDEDSRVKNVQVLENVQFENLTWEYQLNIIDAESISNTDGGYAMQIFWNKYPVKGIAILKPYNINRGENLNNPNAIFRIDYSEASENGYDSQMTVAIAGLPTPATDIFAINSLKMFVGKKGDVVEVYGNTNHPNAVLFTTTNKGFNWAFTASGDDVLNIGTAEVGLPPSTLNSNSRSVILKDYSIKNVFSARINEWYMQTYGVTPSQTQLDIYLVNTQAPGFFNNNGFVVAGLSPTAAYDRLVTSMNSLTPYSPYEISNLTLNFKTSLAQ